MIKYCIWDVGQTIYPFSLDALYEWGLKNTGDEEDYKRKHGVKSFDYNPYMRGELTNEEFAKQLCSYISVKYSKKSLIEINKYLHRGVGKPFAETMQSIDFLKKQGIKSGILSNALPFLGDTGLKTIDRGLVFPSYAIGALKPHAEAFQAVRDALGCEYGEMMFIDDKIKNVEAAKQLGICGIVYRKDSIFEDIKQAISSNNSNHRGQKQFRSLQDMTR